jgi:hypothetical protein
MSYSEEIGGRDMRQIEQKQTAMAERVIIGFIVFAATVCVTFITVYLCMFDARGILH